MRMDFRPATPEDVPQVLPMVQKLADLHRAWDPARYDYIDEVGQRYHNWLVARAQDARSVFLVAERHERLVAFVVATVERDLPVYRTGEIGFVHDLWVEPDYRHEGIARQLTTLLLERFTALGVKQVRLETAAANEAARRLFEQCGFRTASIEMLCLTPAEARP